MSNNKKSNVLKQNSKKKLNPISTGIIVVLVAVLAVLIFNNLGAKENGTRASSISSGQFTNSQASAPKPRKAVYTTITPTDGLVSLDTSLFDDGQARYFTYDASGKTVNFFVLKSSDNVLRAAFDACDVCFSAKKGYRQENDLMVCNNCGQQFPSVRINVEQGGCNPAPLERNIVDDKLLLNVSDIESGLRFF
ncbi:MAG: DUF2318 domain-containing protein [Spirochaetaceae bacterium]|nr:DUF2318 domain-containing protein [Spirochaetaceae bacterium]